MKKTYSKSSRQGLPGGPNEMFEKVKGIIVSQRGQWDFPGMNTLVPTDDGRITMRGVPYPVYGQDETGYGQMMYPNQEYQFPGNNVLELPMAQRGGGLPKFQGVARSQVPTYNDSLDLYKNTVALENFLRSKKAAIPTSKFEKWQWENSQPIVGTTRNWYTVNPTLSPREKALAYANSLYDIDKSTADKSLSRDNYVKTQNNLIGTRDWATGGGDDKDFPVSYVHPKIKPQFEGDTQIPGEGMFYMYRYDPVAIKPGALLTPKELALRLKKYGKRGIPQSKIDEYYASKNPVTPLVTPPANIIDINKPNQQTSRKEFVRNINQFPFQLGPNQYEQRVSLNTPLHTYMMNLDQYSKLLPTDSIPQQGNFLYRLNRQQLGGSLPRFQYTGQFNPQLARPNPITGLYNWEKPRVKPKLSDFEPKQKAAPRSSTSVATKSDPVKAARQINSVAAEEYERNRQGVIRATNRPVSVFRPGAGDPEAVMGFMGVPGTVRFVKNPAQGLKGAGNTIVDLGLTVSPFANMNPAAGFQYAKQGTNPLTGEGSFRPQDVEGAFNTLDAAGLATIAGAALKAPVQQGLRQTGKYLTQGPLRNAYNVLPEGAFSGYSKLRNPNKSYRVAGMDAYDDFVESGLLRSKTPQPQPGMSFAQKMQQRPTAFPSFQKGYADLTYLPEEGGVVFETSLPTFKRGQINPVTGQPIKGRHYAHRVINPQTGATMGSIPGENISVYGSQPHWLKGYPQINTPKQLPGSPNVVSSVDDVGKVIADTPHKAGFIDFKGALQKYPKGPVTQEEVAAYKNSSFYKKNTEEYLDYKSRYGDSWTLPNFAEESLQEAIIKGNRDKINRTLYGGRNWRTSDYVIAGLVGTTYPGIAGIMGLAFSPPVVHNTILPKLGLTNRPATLSSRDTTIDLTNRNMDFAKVNEFKDGQIIIGGEFIETANNTVRKAKDWLNATDTYSDKEYPSKDIQSFYGIENGKFKVGKASDFNSDTEIVPRRFGAVNINKAVLNNNKMRLLDKKGNPIYQNTPNTGKFILYSPSTKKAEFKYINSGKTGVNAVNKFLKENKDAEYIHLDNGRYEFYGINNEGLTNYDYESYYHQDLEREGNPGYNLILKKQLGGSLPKAQVGGDEIFPGEGQYYNIPEYTYNYKRGFNDLPTPRYTGPLMNQRLIDEATQREYEQRRRAIEESVAAAREPLSTQRLARESAATGDKFSLQMNLGDPYNNPRLYETLGALDFINPGVMLGDMVTGLGSVPYNVQEGNYGAATFGLGLPLATGALASIGVKTPRQFVNNLVNPVAGIGDTPKQLPGSSNVYQNYFQKLNLKEHELQKLHSSGKIDYNTYVQGIKNYQQELLKDLGVGSTLGRGSYGEVFEFANNPSKVIKLGEPYGGKWTPQLIEDLKSVRQNQNIAIPEEVIDVEVPSLYKNYSPHKKQAIIMPNLNKVSTQNLGLNKRDRYALFLKQARQLRDKGIKLDVENLDNFKFNKDKGVFDIYDINPGVITNPVYYMQYIKDRTKGKLLDYMMYKYGGLIPPAATIGAGAYGVNQMQDAQPTMKRFGGKLNFQGGGNYNMQRALELGYTPDEAGHYPSVDSETGMWLKSKQHPTAWMESMYGYQLNPEVYNNYNVVYNPEGYFGENQLQYVPKKFGGSLPTAGDPVLNFIQRQSPRFSKSKK